jgi:hypothetical protein
MSGEQAVIERRRKGLFAEASQHAETWGLALSGGGIRSATFCLGVLQALAQAKFSHSGDVAKDDSMPLLARFDFLSTVSGGGYAGAFLSALFRPRKRDAAMGEPVVIAPEKAASEAYAALRQDPPGRLGSAASLDAVDTPVRWLRENGRYLTPNGPGDLLYDIAIAIRNWLSVHYIAAVTLITLFLLAFAFRQISVQWLGVPAQQIELLVQAADFKRQGAIWGSPWFVAAAVWVALAVIPLGVAYWYRLDWPPKASWSPANPWVAASIVVLLAVCLFILTNDTPFAQLSVIARMERAVLLLLIVTVVISIVIFHVANVAAPDSSRGYRGKVTRWLANSMRVTFVIVAFALVETGGQTLYLWLRNTDNIMPTLTGIAGVVVTLVSIVRKFSPALAQPDKGGLASRILPMDAMLGAAGVTLLLVVLICWHATATLFFLGSVELSNAAAPLVTSARFNLISDPHSWVFLLVCVAATFAAGSFLGFINLSGLQAMYSARLTRAYLGASNRTRFAGGNSKLMHVTEPDMDDDFARGDYFDGKNLGPAHIINVTINATTGSGDQLTQRDRQGLPMAITPDGITVEGECWTQSDMAELTIGQWIGISGAAFSTGVGRGTSLGKALLFGFANVRLGWWWKSGLTDKKATRTFWRTQVYLMRELRARFVGKEGSHWYLSDGGHFENTAVFELLRRQVEVAVCCDCGADPQYEFEDLANLMRLARIDLAADFTSIGAAATPILSGRAADLAPYVALNPAEFAAKEGADNKCLLLYRVNYKSSNRQTLLIVVKPRRISDATLDIVQYQSANTAFPQQSTFDQFFDDAQWESYRKLGALIGAKLFPA